MTTRRKVWIGVLIFAIFVACYYPFSPAGRQAANMRLAEQHAAKLKQQIESDPRFKNVRFGSGTVAGGSLYVIGEVPTEADAVFIRDLVDKSQPPINVAFHVYLTPATQKAGLKRMVLLCRQFIRSVTAKIVFRTPVTPLPAVVYCSLPDKSLSRNPNIA